MFYKNNISITGNSKIWKRPYFYFDFLVLKILSKLSSTAIFSPKTYTYMYTLMM